MVLDRDACAPSVIVVSQRRRTDSLGRLPGYVSFAEGEDVLANSADAELLSIDVDPSRADIRLWRKLGHAYRRGVGRADPIPWNRFGPRVTSDRPLRDEYDLLVIVGYTMWDLTLLEAIPDVRDRVGTIVAWFPEAWVSSLETRGQLLEPFNLADHVFVGMEHTAHQLDRVIEPDVRFVPPAVDVLRFCPAGSTDHRPIDLLNIGRRDPGFHETALEWSSNRHTLYVYDSAPVQSVDDGRTHREKLADTYRRTKVAITNHAKFDLPEVVRDQREIPGRFWEGLASGVIMAGDPPDEDRQRALVGQTVVTPLPTDPAAAIDVIDGLATSDLDARRADQVRLAMNGHDWAHRWRDILEASGVPVPVGITDRIDRLSRFAESLQRSA